MTSSYPQEGTTRKYIEASQLAEFYVSQAQVSRHRLIGRLTTLEDTMP